MKIISLNVNGLRAFYNKGALTEVFKTFDPDVLCLQETKCDEDTVKALVNACLEEYPEIPKYITYANSSKGKSGYAGVATLVKESIVADYGCIATEVDLIEESDSEDYKYYASGRIVIIKILEFQLINVYTLNSGGKEDMRPTYNDRFNNLIKNSLAESSYLIITGDLNVVATELDYWGNYYGAIDSGPGLYQFEIDDFANKLDQFNLIDAFRYMHPSTKAFSWYNYRGPARRLNRGWRLDYFLVSPELQYTIKDSRVYQDFEGSDHRPIELILSTE